MVLRFYKTYFSWPSKSPKGPLSPTSQFCWVVGGPPHPPNWDPLFLYLLFLYLLLFGRQDSLCASLGSRFPEGRGRARLATWRRMRESHICFQCLLLLCLQSCSGYHTRRVCAVSSSRFVFCVMTYKGNSRGVGPVPLPAPGPPFTGYPALPRHGGS